MKPFEMEIDGERHQVYAQNINGQIWVHLFGKNILLESESQKATRRKSTAGKHSGEITAPMPGKVTKIFHSAGSRVSKGDALIVMEAMKMEYTLKAEVSGVVESLHCQVNDQVTLGKILVQIKAENT